MKKQTNLDALIEDIEARIMLYNSKNKTSITQFKCLLEDSSNITVIIPEFSQDDIDYPQQEG